MLAIASNFIGKSLLKFYSNSEVRCQFNNAILLGAAQLRDHDTLKLQVLSTKDGWLGCPDTICDLRTCPSRNNNYLNFDGKVGEKNFK